MVRVLSNGEIVQDSDPRVNQRTPTQQQGQGQGQGRPRPRQGHIQHDEDEDAGGGGGGAGQAYAAGLSVFHSLNQRLLDAGVPRWNAGPYVVEPLVSVGMLLAFFLFGVRGLVFGGLLFAVSVWSQSRETAATATADRRDPQPGPSSSGHRLGQS